MENYVNCPLSDKSMKFCIVVVHDLTNDISYSTSILNFDNSILFYLANFLFYSILFYSIL